MCRRSALSECFSSSGLNQFPFKAEFWLMWTYLPHWTRTKSCLSAHRDQKERNIKKDEEIKALNSRVEELDQLTKLNNVIITGLQIKPRTYAKAAANVNNEDTKLVQNQVTEYLEAKGITLNPENVESCFLLPSKGIEKKRAVVLKFTSKTFKIDLMQQIRKNGQLFEDKVFINEHLTKQNANLPGKQGN